MTRSDRHISIRRRRASRIAPQQGKLFRWTPSSTRLDTLPAGNSFTEMLPSAIPTPAAFRDYAGGAAPLNDAQEQATSLLQAATLTRRLPILNIQYGMFRL